MSEPRRFAGYVDVAEAPPGAMVSLRADLSAEAVRAAVAGVTGAAVPEARRIETAGGTQAAWMAPDELLILAGAGQGAGLAARLGEALAGEHHLALDVSDMRARFRLSGQAVREVLAKLTPADVAGLPVGEMRRTRLAQVAAGVWLTSQGEAEVMVFRSVADYAFALLSHAARPGSEVG